MADNWGAAKAKAQKILGKDATIPEPKSLDKIQSGWVVAYSDYEKARDALEDRILGLQKAGSNAKLTLKQYAEQVDVADFGLDGKKNPDDAKKIKEARGVLSDWVDGVLEKVEADIDGLDELDKHVIDFKKYKPAQGRP